MSAIYQTNNELEKHYLSIKKKLEHFQYNYPLGIESVQLVDKLLNDLLKTTQGFQEVRTERDKLREQLESERQIPLPLKNENSKLVRENNELHRELIKLKEDIDLKDLNATQARKKLESEKEEFSFLLKQKESRIISLEGEAENLRKKMNEVLSKLYNTTNETHTSTYSINPKLGLTNAEKFLKSANAMNTGRNIIGKKVEFDMTKGLEANTDYENLINTQTQKKLLQEMAENNGVDKEQWANDLKIADQRAEKMRHEIKKLDEDKIILLGKIEFLEKQLQSRDLEIRRIQSSSLINSNNLEELKMRYQTDQMKNTIDKLNNQIDFLNQENQKLKSCCDFHSHRCKEEEVRKLDKEIIQLKKDKEALNKKIEAMASGVLNTPSSNVANNKTLQNQKPSHNLQNSPSAPESNQQLLTQIKQLQEDLEKTKTQLFKSKEENKVISSNFNSEKLALVKSIDSLKNELVENKKKFLEIENNNEALAKLQEQTLTELNLLKGRELIFNKDIESKTDNVNKIYKEYNNLIIDNKDLRKKTSDLEEKNLQTLKDLKEIKLEKESLLKKNSNLERSFNSLQEQYEMLKIESDALQKNLEKNQNQKMIIDTKNKISEEENENLNQIIEEKNSIIKELENKKENLLKQLTEANDNYITLQADNKNLSSEIQTLLLKNKKLEDKTKIFEKEFNESKYVKEKLSEFEEKEKIMKNETKALERENKILTNEIKYLNEKIRNSSKDNEKLNEDIKKLLEEKKKLMGKIESNSEELYKIEEKEKNLSDLNLNIEEFKNQISELNAKIQTQKREMENFKSEKSEREFEIKKKNLEILRLNETIEKNMNDIKHLKDENKILSNNNEKLEEKIFNQRLQENTNVEINLIEVQELLEQEKSLKEKLAFDYKTLQEKFQKLGEEKNSLDSKVVTMTKLLNEADKTREELFSKLQEEIRKNKIVEGDSQIIKEKEHQWLNEFNKLKEENITLRTGLNSIDDNYNSLNMELDQKTEENAKLNNLVHNLKLQNDDLTKKLQIQLNKTSLDSKRMNDREEELAVTKETLLALEHENFELKSALEERVKQLHDLNYDLQNVQNENQALIEDLNRISKEAEKQVIIKAQLEKNVELFSQKNRALEIDLNELHSNYKDICGENERLKQNLKIFIDENREAANYIKQIENALMNYKNNIQETITERNNLNNKLEFLEKYNSELTEEISKLKNEMASSESNQNLLIKNLQIDKEITSSYENQIAGLNRHISKLENEKRNLIEEMNKLNNHIEYLAHSKKQNDANFKNYEGIIAEERKKVLNANNSNDKLRNEISNLREENKRILSMINENRDIKELKHKILSSSLSSSRGGNNKLMSNDKNQILETEVEENAVLKRLVNDLNNQIEELKRDLQTVREENVRLISERSVKDSLDRGLVRENSSGTNSVYSMSNR